MDEREKRLKRLRYQSWHRGCKETDVILGNYFDHYGTQWDIPMITLYEKLLDEDDKDIWRWVAYNEMPSDAAYLPVVEALRSFHEYAKF